MLANTPHALKANAASVDEIVASLPGHREFLFLLSSEGNDECLRDLRALRAHYATSRIVLISESFDLWSTIAALQAGASGCVLSTHSGETLVRAIDLVLTGVTVLPDTFSKALLDELQWSPYAWQPPMVRGASKMAHKACNLPPPVANVAADPADLSKPLASLSERELDILSCLTVGACNKDIARSTGMAEATVKTHLKTILRKLSVANRTQAALWALKHVPHLAEEAPETPLGGD